jgi:hypothetical protein
MKGKSLIHLGRIQNAVTHHHHGAAAFFAIESFLRWLEAEFDIAGQFIFMGIQDLCNR